MEPLAYVLGALLAVLVLSVSSYPSKVGAWVPSYR